MSFTQAAGVSATELSQDFATLNKTHFLDDPDKEPLVLADEYTTSEFASAEVVLASTLRISPLLAIPCFNRLTLLRSLFSCSDDPRS